MIHDAEKLLGGYATGTLTETERSELFAAALKDQALFDALADEEALREVLADPAARAQLLQALAEAPAPKVVPFWRRHPGALGLAASLLIAVTAGVAYLRTPLPPAAQVPPPASAKPMDVAPKAEPQPLSEGREAPLRKERQQLQAPKEAPPTWAVPSRRVPVELPESAAGAAPSVSPAPVAPPPPAPEKAKADAFADSARTRAASAQEKEEATEKKAERKANQAAPATVEVVAEAPASAGAIRGGTTTSTEYRMDALPSGRALGATGSLAPGVVASPAWSFEQGKDGGLVLRVHHLPGTHSILLRRTSTGPVQVIHLQASTTGQGLRLTTFPLPANPGPMDLYVLPSAPAEPLKLPPEGPIQGFRARIEAPKPQ